MGERSQYAPGTFSWADLATTDQQGAKAFYGALFGWEAEDLPVGDDAVYSMQRIGGRNVAAISAQPQQQREAGVPPMWNNYVTVESADAAAQRAAELGGTIHMPAFDVMDAGRMAVLTDPQGAFFMVWEARENIGAALVNAPGAMCWNELYTTDMEGAASFYSGLFGWQPEPYEDSPAPYTIVRNGGRGNGGITPVQPPDAPPYWIPYFATEALGDSLDRVGELGGSSLAGPFELPFARIAIVRDPQGAVFALYQGQLED